MRRVWVVVGAVALVVAGGVGSYILFAEDDDDGEPSASTSEESSATTSSETSTTVDLGPQTFGATGLPFTFEYPGTFAPVGADDLPEGFLAILGIDPVNFIDVRLTATEEISDEVIIDDIGGALAAQGIEVVDQSTIETDEAMFITFEVNDTTGAAPTTSRLHFVRAGGQTYELACQFDAAGRSTIEDACDTMIETFTIVD